MNTLNVTLEANKRRTRVSESQASVLLTPKISKTRTFSREPKMDMLD